MASLVCRLFKFPSSYGSPCVTRDIRFKVRYKRAAQWGGVRATLGVLKGKFYFTVKLEDNLATVEWPTFKDGPLGEEWPTPRHCARVGISTLPSSLALVGETEGSCAYDSSGIVYGKLNFSTSSCQRSH